MSRAPSRLRLLEHNLKTPRKPRAKSKSRALTVMRFEGAGRRAAAQHALVGLPRDLEEQIAIVRGRAVAKPSRGLLQLEARLLRSSEPAGPGPVIQRYDYGVSSPASPAPSAAPSQAAPAAKPASAFADEPLMAGSSFSGHFNVESFDDTGWVAPTRSPSPGITACRPPVASPTTPNLPVERTLVATAGETASGEAERSGFASRKSALNAEQKEVAENFERDLAAMLGNTASQVEAPEDKQWDNALRTVAQPPPAPSTAAAPRPMPAPPPPPRPDAHEVFHQMGLAMNYANRFDLGAVDLSSRFDQFERELALEAGTPSRPAAGPPVSVQALELDEFDLVADLTELSGASSAPSQVLPNAAAMASESSNTAPG